MASLTKKTETRRANRNQRILERRHKKVKKLLENSKTKSILRGNS